MLKSILDQLGVQVMPLIVTSLGALLCALIGMLTVYVKSKTGNTKVQGAMDRLDQVMEDAVKATQQQVVSAIKPTDNMAQALADAKAAAIASAKAHYGEKGIEELKKILGWDDALLEKNMSTKVEAKVHDLKTETKTA